MTAGRLVCTKGVRGRRKSAQRIVFARQALLDRRRIALPSCLQQIAPCGPAPKTGGGKHVCTCQPCPHDARKHAAAASIIMRAQSRHV